MDLIIEELYKLIELLKKTKTDDAGTEGVKEAIKDIELIITQLQFDDLGILGHLTYIFMPQGDLYKIAKAGGWTDKLSGIEGEVNWRIGAIRIAYKRHFSKHGKIKSRDDSYSDNPGYLTISNRKWREVAGAYRLNLTQRLKMRLHRKDVQELLFYGDTQPAIVMSLAPFLVAAYSSEMDAVVLMEFPAQLAKKNGLKLYDRLVTVNTYDKKSSVNYDIFVGENYCGVWTNFFPLIGDLLSGDRKQLEQHKKNVPEWMWQYVRKLGDEYLWEHRELSRWGFWFAPESIYFRSS